MSLLNVRPCPVCECDEKNVVFRQTFDPLSEGSLSEGYDVAVCRRCGFAFADRIPEQSVFDRYYAEMSKYEYEQRGGQESASDLARFKAIADELQPFIPAPDARILDLGCSNGRLLAVLREKGFANVTGLDPSPACARDARELYGVKVFTGSLASNDLPKEPFDLIIMIGVLEHIRDLGEAMATVSRMLKPRGRILLEVPDATGFADWPDAPYQQFSTEHVCFFSPVSLRNLMNRHGFALINNHTLARDQTASTVMPVVSSVFERTTDALPPLESDRLTEAALRHYVLLSETADEKIRATIAEIVSSQREILVWGVGTHTQRLMKTSPLFEANIVGFVDSNAKYQSRELHGIPIISPKAVPERREPILISSRAFQSEIVSQIRSDLKCSNELILLYDL
jgi:SAM-dependent methyltransferase